MNELSNEESPRMLLIFRIAPTPACPSLYDKSTYTVRADKRILVEDTMKAATPFFLLLLNTLVLST